MLEVYKSASANFESFSVVADTISRFEIKTSSFGSVLQFAQDIEYWLHDSKEVSVDPWQWGTSDLGLFDRPNGRKFLPRKFEIGQEFLTKAISLNIL